MSVTLQSPNTGNLSVGKGSLYFTKEGGAETHLGNCPSFEFTPTVDTLDHFSSMAGIKSKDKVVILTKGGTIKIVMEEWTAYNVGLMLLGSVDESPLDGPEVDIFSQDEIAGQLRYVANNDVGPRWDVTLYNCSLKPNAAFSPISDEWGQMELNGEVLIVTGGLNDGKFGLAKLTNLDSVS